MTATQAPPVEVLPLHFGAEELVALAEALGASTFPGVDEALLGEPNSDGRAAAVRAAHRSLVARGALQLIGPGRGRVADEITPTIATMMQPRLVVNLDRRTRAGRRVYLYSVRPQRAVEMSGTPSGVYCLLPFPTAELAARVMHRADLVERDAIDSPTVRFTATQFARVREMTGEPTEALLGELPKGSAPFARALALGNGAVHVRCLTRAARKVSGGSLSWIDGGEHGLWRVEPTASATMIPDDGAAQACEVQPTTATQLCADFLSLLPGQ